MEIRLIFRLQRNPALAATYCPCSMIIEHNNTPYFLKRDGPAQMGGASFTRNLLSVNYLRRTNFLVVVAFPVERR